MVKLSLQFHADKDEMAFWIAGWAREMHLFLALELFAPKYRVELIDRERLGESLRTCEVDRLSLSLAAIDADATSALDFLQRNPDVLIVSFGSQTVDSRSESTIAAMTNDEQSLAAWKAIRNKAKASMHHDGVSVVNPASGARQRLKSHYYSERAQELSRRGVRLLASVGWSEYEFDS